MIIYDFRGRSKISPIEIQPEKVLMTTAHIPGPSPDSTDDDAAFAVNLEILKF